MHEKVMYSIGDMSKICNISKKALRYYDKIGLIKPRRQDYNNYRYYTTDCLLTVPVIKYYKQMGFKLDEILDCIQSQGDNVYRSIQSAFLSKIQELELEQNHIGRKYTSVKDWYDLIREAEMVIENTITDVSIKYLEQDELLFQDQTYENDIKASIINLEWTNYLEQMGNEITGPVILHFSSLKSRMNEDSQDIQILQKGLLPCPDEAKTAIGGCIMASCYHIGPHETIMDTYRKIFRWANSHGYGLAENSYERYVTDYWTTMNCEQFVTEILIKAYRPGRNMEA